MRSLIKRARVVRMAREADAADASGGVVEINLPVASGEDSFQFG